MLLIGGACESDRQRVAPLGPARPVETPDVAGSYDATRLVVQRSGSATDLVGSPDTRLNLRLLPDGTTQGQLKIGSDPQFRTKQSLAGQWKLRLPGRVAFDFAAPTFLEQIAFQIVPSGLTGDWVGEGVRIHVKLQKVD